MFRVTVSQPSKIKFTILNNQRNGDLYREGMKITYFDEREPEKNW